MTTATATPPTEGVVSRNCATGRHFRCLGTVAVYPPVNGHTLVGCACRECAHGAGE